MFDTLTQKPHARFRHTLPCARNWQPRSEFEDLCRWWRNPDSCGVFAFVGIGGAGKTAMAERFIRQIPRVTANDPDLPKDPTLPTPDGLFVFSLYEEPHPEFLFEDLFVWLVSQFPLQDNRPLQPDAHPQSATATQVTDALTDIDRRILIVLDGLEKVQDDGSRSDNLGHIEDGGLREFLKRVAAGFVPSLGVLVTTRFPLDDLEFYRESGHARHFYEIGVDQLQPEACITLLRRRGVRGNDNQLNTLSADCGFHALTVDLAGGYLYYFHGGDANVSLNLSQADAVTNNRIPRKDYAARELAGQFVTFNHIAERYFTALWAGDRASLALLQRLCLFRNGVTLATLAHVFLGPDKQRVSGRWLSRLSIQEVLKKLDFLSDLRLIETSRSTATKEQDRHNFTVHPAIRQNFLRTLGHETARLGHEAASREFLDSLGGIPSPEITTLTPHVLELIEEIIFHLVSCQEFQAAWNILWENLGGYTTLGWRFAANQRGDRICRSFFAGGLPPMEPLPNGLSSDSCGKLLLMTGLFQKDLGRLHAAKQCFESQIRFRQRQGRLRETLTGYQNLCEVAILEGNLRTGKELSLKTIYHAGAVNDPIALWGGHVFKAHIEGLGGSVDSAFRHFATALHFQQSAERLILRPLYSLSAVFLSLLHLRIGRTNDALKVINESDALCSTVTRDKGHMFSAHSQLVLVEVALQDEDLALARSALRKAKDWGINHDSPEVLCLASLGEAKVLIKVLLKHLQAGTSDVESLIQELHNTIARGLVIARQCGYGIIHVDLLLASAQAHLITGEPSRALDDLRIALTEGHKPSVESGLPILRAATDTECDYVWGIAEGRHLRAQGLLLQAAQMVGQSSFSPAGFNGLPLEVRSGIESARQELENCVQLRRRIKDRQLKDTERVTKELQAGLLTHYSLKPVVSPGSPGPSTVTGTTMAIMTKDVQFDVFLSHNSHDKATVRTIGTELKARGLSVWLDEWELVPGRPWQEALEDIIQTAKSAAVLVGVDGFGPWEIPEMRACLFEFVNRKLPVIPVLLPGASKPAVLPLFLRQFTWVDLCGGMTKEGFDRLAWGITGQKP